jgi:hypothetical protein
MGVVAKVAHDAFVAHEAVGAFVALLTYPARRHCQYPNRLHL